jgi:hypothetical protein
MNSDLFPKELCDPLELILASFSGEAARSLLNLQDQSILLHKINPENQPTQSQLCHISMHGDILSLNFRLHITHKQIEQILKESFSKNLTYDEILDWGKEFCNVVAGYVSKIMQQSNSKIEYSLPITTPSYFLTLSKEYYQSEKKASWKITTPFGPLICSFCASRFEPSLDFLSITANQIKNTTLPQDPETL